ncbi:hypothetical protein Q9K02_14215 [Qipengyuania sp. G39]|uniref:Uncharacterized protein n=1 Tax=Qipengyuania profundimaris TaxID=3067652 RepID=A0ABT9HT18_9SPHN|nr:hypothetical protein [Qipengyuania sp. G39]MDP4576292.1 hypothetical protein [Qipengyuania sp. G39]
MTTGRRQTRKGVIRLLALVGGLIAIGFTGVKALQASVPVISMIIALLILTAITIVHVRAYRLASRSNGLASDGSRGMPALIVTTFLSIYSIVIVVPQFDLWQPILIPGVVAFIGAAFLVNEASS